MGLLATYWPGVLGLGQSSPGRGGLGVGFPPAAPLGLTCLAPLPSLVRQYADICLFNTAQYKCPVAMEEAE